MANKSKLIDCESVIAQLIVKIEKAQKGLLKDYGHPTSIIAMLTEEEDITE